MKRLLQILFLISAASLRLYAQSDTLSFKASVAEEDSVEYELIVLDPGFDSFLVMQPPREYYSKSYYENWNYLFVMEWNNRHNQPLRYGSIYETYIDYSPGIDYGLELNYRLYYYFRFFEKEHGIRLLAEKMF